MFNNGLIWPDCKNALDSDSESMETAITVPKGRGKKRTTKRSQPIMMKKPKLLQGLLPGDILDPTAPQQNQRTFRQNASSSSRNYQGEEAPFAESVPVIFFNNTRSSDVASTSSISTDRCFQYDNYT